MEQLSLERFLTAQNNTYQMALSEIQNGQKHSHWMWFIFPQIKGLGRSETAKYYAIENFEEAKQFWLLMLVKSIISNYLNNEFRKMNKIILLLITFLLESGYCISYEKAHQFMDLAENYNASPSRYQILNKAQRDWWGFLKAIEKNTYPQEVLGQVIYDIVRDPDKMLPLVAQGKRIKTDIYRDLLTYIEYFQGSSLAEDIYIEMIKKSTNIIAFRYPGTSRGLPIHKEKLKKLIPYVNTKYWNIYLRNQIKLTSQEKKEFLNYRKRVLQGTELLLHQSNIPRFDRLKKDPAFPFYKKVASIGIEFQSRYDMGMARDKKQWEFLVARSLYYRGVPLSHVNSGVIQTEVDRILKIRENYKDEDLFSGKDVFVFAGFEKKKITDDPYVFGKDIVMRSIRKKGGFPHRVRPQNESRQSDQRAKTQILQNIATSTAQSRTFIFDMHGEKNKLTVLNGVEITAQNLFDAYVRRWKEKNTWDKKDVFIFTSCRSHRFILEQFYPLVEAHNKKHKQSIPLPIFLFSSEYDQYGQIDYNSPYGNEFFERTLKFSFPGKTNIESVIWNERLQEDTNPSLYVPDEDNKPVQICLDDEGLFPNDLNQIKG